ncbi:unnamed protein product [Prorocentrum cordatum]|uniref:Ion transport domain-containing protein n=1 Tax=Prorocentrum cordatum TaxID=2364126 RepID=A0ABN9V051_9DINO|nr:unnamed protein product [Polarella glacialis]
MASSGDCYKPPQPGGGADPPVPCFASRAQSPAFAKMADLRALRDEVEGAARQARLRGLWKHQVRAFDFYHDYGRRRPYVQASVAKLIVANFLCDIAPWQWDPEPDLDHRRHKALWFALDYAFNLAFLVELLVNMYGKWMRPFFRDGWNVFDLVVVTVGVVDMLQVPVSHSIKMVRLLRAFRVLRLLKRVESLRRVVMAIANALPAVLNVLVLCSILISISKAARARHAPAKGGRDGGYAIIAVDLFGDLYSGHEEDPVPGAITARGNLYGEEYYGTFAAALFTLLQVLTGESWSEAGVRPPIHLALLLLRPAGPPHGGRDGGFLRVFHIVKLHSPLERDRGSPPGRLDARARRQAGSDDGRRCRGPAGEHAANRGRFAGPACRGGRPQQHHCHHHKAEAGRRGLPAEHARPAEYAELMGPSCTLVCFRPVLPPAASFFLRRCRFLYTPPQRPGGDGPWRQYFLTVQSPDVRTAIYATHPLIAEFWQEQGREESVACLLRGILVRLAVFVTRRGLGAIRVAVRCECRTFLAAYI